MAKAAVSAAEIVVAPLAPAGPAGEVKPVDLTPFPLAKDAATRLILSEITNPRTRERLVASATRILGSPEDAEDCVQDALLQAARFAEQFAGRSSPYSWLYRVVLNTCRMRRRAEGRDRRGGGAQHLSIDDLASHPSAAPDTDPELSLVGQQTLEVLRRELAQIPRKDSELFELHVLQDVPLRTLAAQHHLTRQAVKSRLFRVRRRLSDQLSEAQADPKWSETPSAATL